MGLFDSLQNIVGGLADSVQSSVGDAIGGLGEIPGLQETQDLANSLGTGVAEAVTSTTEQVQATVEDITGNFGL